MTRFSLVFLGPAIQASVSLPHRLGTLWDRRKPVEPSPAPWCMDAGGSEHLSCGTTCDRLVGGPRRAQPNHDRAVEARILRDRANDCGAAPTPSIDQDTRAGLKFTDRGEFRLTQPLWLRYPHSPGRRYRRIVRELGAHVHRERNRPGRQQPSEGRVQRDKWLGVSHSLTIRRLIIMAPSRHPATRRSKRSTTNTVMSARCGTPSTS